MSDLYGDGLTETLDGLEGVGDDRPRCDGCNRLLAEFATRPWVIRCGRCKKLNVRDLHDPPADGPVATVATALDRIKAQAEEHPRT